MGQTAERRGKREKSETGKQKLPSLNNKEINNRQEKKKSINRTSRTNKRSSNIVTRVPEERRQRPGLQKNLKK